MGHKYTKDEILQGALATAYADGLSQLTFGRVAKRLNITDRMVVYYFPTKDDLTTEVILSMGARLQEILAAAFDQPAKDYLQLVRAAWPVLGTSKVDPTFALFFEANGLAAARREPYKSLVPQLIDAWVSWLADFIEGSPSVRRAEAETAIAVIDGLLLLRLLTGPKSAERAAKTLGVK